MAETLKDKTSAIYGDFMNSLSSVGEAPKIRIVLTAIFAYIALKWFHFLSGWKRRYARGSPVLMSSVHHGMNPMVINTSNPERENFIELPRSTNEEHGEEFSFVLWVNVSDIDVSDDKWKHIFHRGNRSRQGIAAPGRAPAVYFHPKSNSLRIYMNTNKSPFDYTDIHNLPIKKWFHLAIILRGRYLDIYVNGRLKTRKVLSSLPKQNYGDIFLTHEKGFNGFLTGLRYFSYALPYPSLQDIINSGPSAEGENSCLSESGENSPPYFASDWWKTRYSSPSN